MNTPNIVRIDYPKTRAGWRVRIVRQRLAWIRYVWDQDIGGKRAALTAAKALRRILCEDAPPRLPVYRGGPKPRKEA